ncbi:hypothetical protein JXA80_14045 [bacterium]|nr:hypothetical protein [candidate division CSSED10-310 bacterium]
MNALDSIISWRRYLRNRLHRVLQKAGWEALRLSVKIGAEDVSPVSLVQDLDFTLLCQCNSIERYALKIPDGKQRFKRSLLEHLPLDQDADAFSEMLHDHYSKIMDFIATLNAKDLDKTLEAPMFTDSVSVQWILEFGSFYEQSVSSRIITVLAMQNPVFRVPWPTSRFLKPVQKLDIH